MKCVIRTLMLCWFLSSQFEEAFNQISAPDRDDLRTGTKTRVAMAHEMQAQAREPATTTIATTMTTEARKRARTGDGEDEDEEPHDNEDDMDLDQEPELDPGMSHEGEHRKNLTKAEIAAWLRDTEKHFLQKSNTSAHTEEDVEEFLHVLHGSAEAACVLAKSEEGDDGAGAGVTISGQTVTLHVEFITKKLEAQLKQSQSQSQKRNQKPSKPTHILGSRFEVELSDSLSQYCSEVDEGLSYVCYQLCLGTIHFTHGLFLISQPQPGEGDLSMHAEFWDSFLVGSDEALVIDPDTQAFVPVHKPLVFRISLPLLKRGYKAQCLRWNYTHWDNSTCLESQRLSPTVIECRCLQFGYFKIEYLQTGENAAKCPFFEFRVLNASEQTLNSTSIRNQILGQMNLSGSVGESWTIANLEIVRVVQKGNRTILTALSIRFKLKHLPDHAHGRDSGCKGNWKTVVAQIDALLLNESLNIFDEEGKPVYVPKQKLRVIDSDDDEKFLTEMEHMSLAAAAIVLGFFGVVLLVIGVVAIRKYRRKRRNSVRVLKVGNSFDRSLVSVSALRSNSNQPPPPPCGRPRPPKTNVRRMSFGPDYPDQNQNSFSNTVANVGGLDSNLALNLHALPNSTLD